MFVIIKEFCCCLFFYFVLYILILWFLFFGIFVLVDLIKCNGYFWLFKKLVGVDFFVIYDYGVNIYGYFKWNILFSIRWMVWVEN